MSNLRRRQKEADFPPHTRIRCKGLEQHNSVVNPAGPFDNIYQRLDRQNGQLLISPHTRSRCTGFEKHYSVVERQIHLAYIYHALAWRLPALSGGLPLRTRPAASPPLHAGPAAIGRSGLTLLVAYLPRWAPKTLKAAIVRTRDTRPAMS